MRVYLDHAATTPIDPAASAAMAEASARWANPSSVHAEGRAARAALEDARRRVAAALGWSGAVVFTSGGTEALALALASSGGAHFAGATEHAAVRLATPDARSLPVQADGTIDLAALQAALAGADRPLVAAMHANNETGVLHPIADIARIVRAAGGRLVVDCVQSAGKIDLPDADLLAVSAHKLGGPPGVGALLVRDPAALPTPGGQEGGHRPGTENLPAIMAFAAALEARADRGWAARAGQLRARLETRVAAAGGEVIAARSPRLPTIACLRMPGAEAMLQLIALDLEGYAVSAGAACSSGRVKASHVLTAMGHTERSAGEAIRVSLGHATTAAEVESFAAAWEALAARLTPARAA